ncbi:hypothetical protein C2E23DRAFT_227950 [Lenzites betulinus]|nr:hypothetical protein C2E23DRAFT_227950 [Lenzites betulinus]
MARSTHSRLGYLVNCYARHADGVCRQARVEVVPEPRPCSSRGEAANPMSSRVRLLSSLQQAWASLISQERHFPLSITSHRSGPPSSTTRLSRLQSLSLDGWFPGVVLGHSTCPACWFLSSVFLMSPRCAALHLACCKLSAGLHRRRSDHSIIVTIFVFSARRYCLLPVSGVSLSTPSSMRQTDMAVSTSTHWLPLATSWSFFLLLPWFVCKILVPHVASYHCTAHPFPKTTREYKTVLRLRPFPAPSNRSSWSRHQLSRPRPPAQRTHGSRHPWVVASRLCPVHLSTADVLQHNSSSPNVFWATRSSLGTARSTLSTLDQAVPRFLSFVRLRL